MALPGDLIQDALVVMVPGMAALVMLLMTALRGQRGKQIKVVLAP